MGEFNDKVFGLIGSDFLEKGENSFLYKYLSESMTDKAPTDRQIRAKARDLMYNLGYPLSAMTRLNQAKEAVEHYEFGGGKREFQEKVMVHDSSADKKRLLDKKKAFEEELSKDLSEAEENRKSNRGRKGQKSGKAHNNTALDLVDRWVSERGYGSGTGDEADLEDCEKMYSLLKGSPEYARVRIPIRIDRETGAGVYIIGNEYYPGRSRIKGKSCQLAIFYPSGDTDDYEIVLWDEGYPTVKEAFRFFAGTVIMESLRTITMDNDKAPEGTPEEFIKYFGRDDLYMDDVLSFTEEEYSETVNLFKR